MSRPTTTSGLLLTLLIVTTAQAQPIVVLIGGNHSDPSPAQLAGQSGRGGNSGLWRLKGDLLAEDKLTAEYFNWNGTRAGKIDAPDPGGAHAIERRVRALHALRPEAPIILVGNSWGGHTAWQVCHLLAGGSIDEEIGSQHSVDASSLHAAAAAETTEDAGSGVGGDEANARSREPSVPVDASAVLPVELVVFLDPSSFGRGKDPKPTTLPNNVQQAVNYYTHNSFGWGAWPDEPRLVNVDLGDPANGFQMPGGPKYNSALNWRAHVSAEWDERIHADIRRRIVDALTPVKDAR